MSLPILKKRKRSSKVWLHFEETRRREQQNASIGRHQIVRKGQNKNAKKIVENSSTISLAHDIWSAMNGKSYLGVICNNVNDDFELETFFIGFEGIL